MGITQLNLREDKIDFWLCNGKNILLVGTTGVGKTQLFREGMARLGLSFGILEGQGFGLPQRDQGLARFRGLKATPAKSESLAAGKGSCG